jgi:hypothetical protein
MPYMAPSLICNGFWCPIQGPFFRVFNQGPFLGFFIQGPFLGFFYSRTFLGFCLGGVGHPQLVPLLALLVPLVAQDRLLWNSKKATVLSLGILLLAWNIPMTRGQLIGVLLWQG